MLFLEEQKCEHVAKSDAEWIVDSSISHNVIPTKGLFTTYKTSDFGVVKMSNSIYSKIVRIDDVCIKTNVGCMLMLKHVRHVPDLRMNVFSTLAIQIEQVIVTILAMEDGNYLKDHWLLQEGMLVVVCT